MSHYKHLSIEERESLYLMKNQGESIREIARELNRSPSTISRELQRNKGNHRPYRPSAAQRRYERMRKKCGRKRILSDSGLQEKIRFLIQDRHWSPEQIEHRLKLEGSAVRISYTTIYRAIWAGLFDPKTEYVRKANRLSYHLRRKGKKKRKNGTVNKQGKYAIIHEISERPAEANMRTVLGHWEADTVAGKRGSSRLLTLVDRKSRYLIASKVPDAAAETVSRAMIDLLSALPKEMVKSVTPDRGHEFAKYQTISAAIHDVPFYFADPYSPWQRGTNENTNGLIRECLPKYTDMDLVPDAVLQRFLFLLNRRPRKCLGWLSPYEIFSNTVLHLS